MPWHPRRGSCAMSFSVAGLEPISASATSLLYAGQMEPLLGWLLLDWPLVAALGVSFLAGAETQRFWWRWRRQLKRRRRPTAWRSNPVPSTMPSEFDAAAQLRAVERAVFTSRRLLNRGEARLRRVLEEACAAEATGWRVMAQVSLGEILASPDQAAYRAINSKRVDLLLVDGEDHARHAIELQGSGHHLGPAATRDAIKKEALRRAGIGYVEVVSGDTPAEVRSLVAKLVARERGPAKAV